MVPRSATQNLNSVFQMHFIFDPMKNFYIVTKKNIRLCFLAFWVRCGGSRIVCMFDQGCALTSEWLWCTAGFPPNRWSAPSWVQRPQEEAGKRQTESESSRARQIHEGGEALDIGGSGRNCVGAWPQHPSAKMCECVCSGCVCEAQGLLVCLLLVVAASCQGSSWGERGEARWKEGQRQTRTGASARSLQMNGDKSARAIDPLVKAPQRLQPNVLKKETSAPVGAPGERQSSSVETHLTHSTRAINTESWWTCTFNTTHWRQNPWAVKFANNGTRLHA